MNRVGTEAGFQEGYIRTGGSEDILGGPETSSMKPQGPGVSFATK